MKNILLITLLTFFTSLSLAAKEPKNLDIYLLIGQSNMAGRAKLEKGDDKPIPGAWLLNDKEKFEIAQSPMNRYSTIRKKPSDPKYQKLNLGHTFTITMLKNKKANNIGIICNAKGGSNIDEWAKGSKFYKEALNRYRIAMRSGTLKGILWHQGESNKNDSDYLKKLQTLIIDLRTDLKLPELPFVAGQILQNVSDKGGTGINSQIAQLPKKLKNTAYVSSKRLKDLGDKLHFSNKSQKELGKRYAEAIQKLLKGTK